MSDGVSILDSGIGPGTASKLILKTVKPNLLVGLDGSVKQLKTAKANIDALEPHLLQVVRGSFEFLPFRDNTFNAIITCYACVTAFTSPDPSAKFPGLRRKWPLRGCGHR